MSNEFMRVKISDIARRAGVSTGTVDRVIHNRGEVSEETRSKVLQILKDVNYEPDFFASALATKKYYRFTAIIPEASRISSFWEKPNEGLDSAINEIRPFGVKLDKKYFPYHDLKLFVQQLDEVLQSKPDGLILTPVFAEKTNEYLEIFNEFNIPVVFMNTQIENVQNLAFVGQDTRQSGRVAASMLDYGLEKDEEIFIVNIIREEGGNAHILSREQGFREFFDKKYGDCCKKISTININTQNSDEIEHILKMHFGLDSSDKLNKGVFVTNSRVFIVADFISKNKIRNIRLIGYDLLDTNIKFLREGTIDFLISQNPFEQGYRSIMTLFNKLVMKKEVMKNQCLPIDIITKENIDYYLKN
jgi:LacI family transcriptional regulator